MFGVRWGMGVVTQPMVGSTPHFAQSWHGPCGGTGRRLGTAVANELQRRIDSGAFGQTPQVGDPRFSSVIYMGSGTRNELINTAKALGLNAIVFFSIPQPMTNQLPAGAKRPDDQVKIQIVDVGGKAGKKGVVGPQHRARRAGGGARS